jgi:hypothetical protein
MKEMSSKESLHASRESLDGGGVAKKERSLVTVKLVDLAGSEAAADKSEHDASRMKVVFIWKFSSFHFLQKLYNRNRLILIVRSWH